MDPCKFLVCSYSSLYPIAILSAQLTLPSLRLLLVLAIHESVPMFQKAHEEIKRRTSSRLSTKSSAGEKTEVMYQPWGKQGDVADEKGAEEEKEEEKMHTDNNDGKELTA